MLTRRWPRGKIKDHLSRRKAVSTSNRACHTRELLSGIASPIFDVQSHTLYGSVAIVS